jgi:uncharacterized repeat protein (TIGR01451 family)
MKKAIFIKISLLTTIFFVAFFMGGAIALAESGEELLISKKVINLTTGNLNWQNSITARPLDILSFVITIQTKSQQINNVFVKDILPQGLIYKGNLVLNATLSPNQNPANGISVGTMSPNSVYIISYQAQVSEANNFGYGITVLNNSATITSTQTSNQTVSSQILVNKSFVSGATYIPVGTENNFIKDSFFLPLFLMIIGLWFYFSGNIYKFADWVKSKK